MLFRWLHAGLTMQQNCQKAIIIYYSPGRPGIISTTSEPKWKETHTKVRELY